MTKKHFERLAYQIAMQEPVETPENEQCRNMWQLWVKNMVDFYADQNPRFDRDRFESACHFDHWKNRRPPR